MVDLDGYIDRHNNRPDRDTGFLGYEFGFHCGECNLFLSERVLNELSTDYIQDGTAFACPDCGTEYEIGITTSE